MIASSRRARNERGFALVAALLLAVLFLSLMELTLRDTSESVRSAHAFRARIAAEILADNGAELAAAGMVDASASEVDRELDLGRLRGSYLRTGEETFTIRAEGTAAGVVAITSRVELRGRVVGTQVRITESITN